MLIKIFIIVFAFFAISRALKRFRKEELTKREVMLWTIFWVLVVAATLWPNTTDIFAKLFGVGRGADLLIYISLIALFFIVFKLVVKMEKIEKDITKIVRKMAIDEKKSEQKR